MNGGEGTSIVVGIDEAGYGPMLGPLVVSATVFRAPRELLETNWWQRLRGAILSRPRARDARLAVCDSKLLSARDDGLHRLEQTALTFLSLPDDRGRPRHYGPTLRRLLAQLDPAAVAWLDEYPWYRGADFAIPAAGTADGIRTHGNAVHADLSRSGIRFVGAYVEVLPEGRFNRLLEATRNKSVVLWGQIVRLLLRACPADEQTPVFAYIDKQGGRARYAAGLMAAFDDAHLEIVEEGQRRSAYRLLRRPAPWTVQFVEEGERHHLPVALASIFSKYVRELFMLAFNDYWSRRAPGVAPTAGYHTDARRFLEQIEPHMRLMRLDRRLLIRAR